MRLVIYLNSEKSSIVRYLNLETIFDLSTVNNTLSGQEDFHFIKRTSSQIRTNLILEIKTNFLTAHVYLLLIKKIISYGQVEYIWFLPILLNV